jgi:hypothetical protein
LACYQEHSCLCLDAYRDRPRLLTHGGADPRGYCSTACSGCASGDRRETLLVRRSRLADEHAYWSEIRAEQIRDGDALDMSPVTVKYSDITAHQPATNPQR